MEALSRLLICLPGDLPSGNGHSKLFSDSFFSLDRFRFTSIRIGAWCLLALSVLERLLH